MPSPSVAPASPKRVSADQGAFMRTMVALWPYMWPNERSDLKWRVAFAFLLLVLTKIVTLLVPYTLSFHAKDFDIQRVPHSMGFEVVGKPLGKGRLSIQTALEQFREAGRQPSVVLELWPPYQGDITSTVRLEQNWLEAGVQHLREVLG